MSPRLSPIADVAGMAPAPNLLISPLVGEMPGRAEGGAKDRKRSWLALTLIE
ncbi:hypothetical protein MJ8_62740 [Mesorhizobium sp. J8]|nr:hypothetical protein MJ8_62740 [Mesorhizobium sp. J8]